MKQTNVTIKDMQEQMYVGTTKGNKYNPVIQKMHPWSKKRI
jgi:ligand-binding sensor domain-containing protein